MWTRRRPGEGPSRAVGAFSVIVKIDGWFAALLTCLARCPSPAQWRSGRRTSSSTATTTSTTRRRASSRSSGTSTRIPRLSSSGSLACQTAREAYMRYSTNKNVSRYCTHSNIKETKKYHIYNSVSTFTSDPPHDPCRQCSGGGERVLAQHK